ncbi:hypothetical protein BaRGS_00031397 [Batillaria attramentaria]|uniref:Uncharacterized protein n=1 Tax=Batillaria attramentaria TaxID=370345 RepID=A0ABD0JRX3_9CAEN
MYVSIAELSLHNCGNASDYTTEVPDDGRNTTFGCAGFLQAYSVAWTLTLAKRDVADTLVVGSCGAFPRRCEFRKKIGYRITRPSATTSVLTINAGENAKFVQNGTLTCVIKTDGEEPFNRSCNIIVTRKS